MNMLNELYIKIINGEPELKPYSLEQVKQLIYSTANVILPTVLNTEILATFNYYPVHIRVVNTLEDKLLKYANTEIKRIYKENDRWLLEVEYVLNSHILLQEWEEIKKQRNRILLDTDWIQISDIVTEDTKKSYAAYRELVRDMVRIAMYPCDVIFPAAPCIVYVDDVQLKYDLANRTQLEETEVESIKSFSTPDSDANSKWYKFLVEWSKLGFITDKAIVSNLIKAYTDFTLEDILNTTENEITDIL